MTHKLTHVGVGILLIMGSAVLYQHASATDTDVHLMTDIEARRVLGGQYVDCAHKGCEDVTCANCAPAWGDDCVVRMGGICGRMILTNYRKLGGHDHGHNATESNLSIKCGDKETGTPVLVTGSCVGQCTDSIKCGDTMLQCVRTGCAVEEEEEEDPWALR